MAGLISKDDVSKELKKSRIIRDNVDLQSICNTLEESTNPFSISFEKDTLYNIGTGKDANMNRKEYLLIAMTKLKTAFIDECKKENERFNQTIHKQKINNFEAEGVEVKIRTKDNKVKELGLTCGIFGRMCFYIDGVMIKTDKSQLLRHLKRFIQREEMPQELYNVIDAMFLLHTLPETYRSYQSIF
ncbi:unnamed protein product [Psylliodes chrysocephalus]|uniref:Uncharacterized protein n=1 Tax=Psylliodes chrysocephalus TaxID=3402493 RepID=A0A9P0CX36_9CUCU|nr:unnamed protein product [Psylliodes chrysocephala]